MSAMATVRDRREVEITDLPDDCLSWTPAGRVPIRCTRVALAYDLATGDLRQVTVWGKLTEEADIRRRAAGFLTGSQKGRDYAARGTIVRRYSIAWRTHTALLPHWLAVYVEQFRPRP